MKNVVTYKGHKFKTDTVANKLFEDPKDVGHKRLEAHLKEVDQAYDKLTGTPAEIAARIEEFRSKHGYFR